MSCQLNIFFVARFSVWKCESQWNCRGVWQCWQGGGPWVGQDEVGRLWGTRIPWRWAVPPFLFQGIYLNSIIPPLSMTKNLKYSRPSSHRAEKDKSSNTTSALTPRSMDMSKIWKQTDLATIQMGQRSCLTRTVCSMSTNKHRKDIYVTCHSDISVDWWILLIDPPLLTWLCHIWLQSRTSAMTLNTIIIMMSFPPNRICSAMEGAPGMLSWTVRTSTETPIILQMTTLTTQLRSSYWSEARWAQSTMFW